MPFSTQTLTPNLHLTMLQCVGCRQTLMNPKAYSNHQRACKKYKAVGALRLQQLQLNRAKKVERAPASITADEEPDELVDETQDLNSKLVVVSFFSFGNLLFLD